MNTLVNTARELPEATLRRSLAVQEAAVSFIYGGYLNLTALARSKMLSAGSLLRAAKEDGWVEFRKRVLAAQESQAAAFLDRSPAEMEAIYTELDRRPNIVETLVDERENCLTAMAMSTERGSKAYASLVSSCARLSAEIERLTGTRDFLAELTVARRKGSLGATEEPPIDEGSLVEEGTVL